MQITHKHCSIITTLSRNKDLYQHNSTPKLRAFAKTLSPYLNLIQRKKIKYINLSAPINSYHMLPPAE